jgi:hypothetical protein
MTNQEPIGLEPRIMLKPLDAQSGNLRKKKKTALLIQKGGLFFFGSPNRTKLEPLGGEFQSFGCNNLVGLSRRYNRSRGRICKVQNFRKLSLQIAVQKQ